MQKHLHIILFIFIWVFSKVFAKECEPSVCNFEGKCTDDKQNEKKCQCIEGIFDGPSCGIQIDHCASSPCKNNGECKNGLGTYICNCSQEYSGKDCNSLEPGLKVVYLHYNHVAQMGEKQHIMLVLEKFSPLQFNIEVYTDEVCLEGFYFDQNNLLALKWSDDLRKIAQKYAIRYFDTLPLESGYFTVIEATFWVPGFTKLNVVIAANQKVLMNDAFGLFVYRKQIGCYPKLIQENCGHTAIDKKMLVVDEINYLQPKVERSCGIDSELKIKWKIFDYLGKKLLLNFEQRQPRLKIPAYSMVFDDLKSDYPNAYLIETTLTETSLNGSWSGTIKQRCYISVMMRPPLAVIKGGSERLINLNRITTIDGSGSRDLSRKPQHDQKLKFKWKCSSKEDPTNKYCSKKMHQAKKVLVPAKQLKANCRYVYTLTVRSNLFPNLKHQYSQVIIPTAEDHLVVDIECLRNCKSGYYFNNRMLHLAALCDNCNSGSLTFEWLINDVIHSNQKHLVMMPKSSNGSLTIKLALQSGQTSGFSVITLIERQIREHCDIEPKAGVELETEFRITCTRNGSPRSFASYHLFLGQLLLQTSNHFQLKTNLVKTNQDAAELKLMICYDSSGCSEQIINVPLKNGSLTSSDPVKIKELIVGDESIKRLLTSKDRNRALFLSFIVVQNIRFVQDADKRARLLQTFLETLKNFEVYSFETMQQLLHILHLISPLIPSSNTEMQISLASQMDLTVGYFATMLSNSEFMVDYDFEVSLFKSLNAVSTINNLAFRGYEIKSQTLELQRPNEPFAEYYPDYGELNYGLIDEIYQAQMTTKSIENIITTIGNVANNFVYPFESPLEFESDDITMILFAIETSNASDISYSYGDITLSLKQAGFQSIIGRDANYLSIQVCFSTRNFYWWYPMEVKSFQDKVVTFNAFSSNYSTQNSMAATSAANVRISFHVESFDVNAVDFVVGYVNASSDMPIYRTPCPPNSLMLYEFMELDDDLRVLIEIGRDPRKFMFERGHLTAQKGMKNQFYVSKRSGALNVSSVAILPKPGTKLSTIKYKFRVIAFLCSTWHEADQMWTSEHCRPISANLTGHIECSCNHMSTITAQILNAPTDIDFIRHVYEDSLPINITMTCFSVVTLIVVVILLVCVFKSDDKAYKKRITTSQTKPLQFEYIVSVLTGGRPHAGTSSNVTIQLIGHSSASDLVQVFNWNENNIFQTNSIETFNISTAKHLGHLREIYLSHDNTGHLPSWFCRMVRVKDVSSKYEYIFTVNRWLSLTCNNSLDCRVPLASSEDIEQFNFVYKENARIILAETGFWPFLFGHYEGNLNKKEKFFILVVGIMTSVLLNTLLFGKTDKYNYEDEERQTYRHNKLQWDQYLILFLNCLVSILICFSLAFCFNKAREVKDVEYEIIYSK